MMNATSALALALSSLVARNFSDVNGLSAACARDMLALNTDFHLLALSTKVSTVDVSQLVSKAGIACAHDLRHCPGSPHMCCSAEVDWPSLGNSDLHDLAKAVVSNGHGKLCFSKADVTVDAAGLTLDEHFDALSPIAVGNGCTADDGAQLLALASTACESNPAVTACNLQFDSASCTSSADRCHGWYTLRFLWQYCDAPGTSSTWAVDLPKVLGPDCRRGAPRNGCCYVPLGYDGGPEFGSDCGKVCAQNGREGTSDAFCERSDHSQFGNCFCGATTTAPPGRYCRQRRSPGTNPCSAQRSDYCCDQECTVRGSASNSPSHSPLHLCPLLTVACGSPCGADLWPQGLLRSLLPDALRCRHMQPVVRCPPLQSPVHACPLFYL